MIRAAVALALLVTVGAVPAATAQSTLPPAAHSCAPSDGLDYICGPAASEDLARVPGTCWLVASSINVGEPAQLYLIDSRTKRATSLFPTDKPLMRLDAALRTGCTGPPRLEKMSTDDINMRAALERLFDCLCRSPIA